MTLRTPEDAQQTMAALRNLQEAVSALSREIAPKNPANFALMAQGYEDEIAQLQGELDDYLRELSLREDPSR